MKKLMQVTVCVLLIAALLCACGANFEPEAKPFAEEMMAALKDGDTEAAMELMHPSAVKQIDDIQASMKALCDYVDGRGTTEITQQSINVRNQIGTNSGKYESGTFRAALDDGTVLKIDYVYLTNAAGSGFSSFYLSIGS